VVVPPSVGRAQQSRADPGQFLDRPARSANSVALGDASGVQGTLFALHPRGRGGIPLGVRSAVGPLPHPTNRSRDLRGPPEGGPGCGAEAPVRREALLSPTPLHRWPRPAGLRTFILLPRHGRRHADAAGRVSAG
jgi:hypothetical protein